MYIIIISMDYYNNIVKTIIIGNAGVGKSCLCHKIINNEIKIEHLSTIGVDFFTKVYEINNYKLKLNIWDTAGQERFNNITKSFFRQAEFVILMFDYNNNDSFTNLSNWLEMFKNNCNVDNPIIIVIGNKLDLKHKVDFNDVYNFCIENKLKLYNTSLKKDNFEETFYQIIKENFIPNKYELVEFDNKSININNTNNKFKCC